MYAYQWWADTTTGLLKIRNSANSAWVTLFELDGTLAVSDISLGAGTLGAPSLFFTGDSNTGLFSPGADTLALVTGGTNRVHVTSGGLVGLGTNIPNATFDCRGNATFTGNGTARQTADFTNTSGQLYVGVESSAGGAVFTGSSAYAGIIGTNTSTPLNFATNGSLKATLDTSGRLLVGTSSSSSSALVQVNGTAQATKYSSNLGGTTASLGNGSSETILASPTTYGMYMVYAGGTGNTSVMGTAIVQVNGGGTPTVTQLTGAATGITIEASGSNVIITNNTATQSYYWKAVRFIGVNE